MYLVRCVVVGKGSYRASDALNKLIKSMAEKGFRPVSIGGAGGAGYGDYNSANLLCVLFEGSEDGTQERS